VKVVLVHGLTASVEWWDSTVEALKPQHDVHVLELPRLGVHEAATWLAASLHGADDDTALIGHSSGGATAVLAAAEAPEAVQRLVLVAPAGIFQTRSRLAYAAPLLRQTLGEPIRIPHMVRDAWRVGPWRLWRISSGLLRVDLEPVLPRLRAKTLVVWGARDVLLPPKLGQVFEKRIPDARLVVFPDCGHIPMLERPDELNLELEAFLA
jgi:pimeloyl-ACP methyl ester carboxylesterase